MSVIINNSDIAAGSKLTRYWPAPAFLLALFWPLVLAEYPLSLLNEAMIFAIYALGINVLLGYTGFVSIGHGMFLGFGGYGLAIGTLLLGLPTWAAVILTLIVTSVLSLLIGILCMRVSRIQFMVITLAISQMYYGLFVKLRITGGDDGMAGLPRPDLSALNIDIWDTTVFYYYVLAIFAIVLIVVRRMLQSPFGSVLVGRRENEKRMMALGYRVSIYKNLSFALSGTISGVAGLLLAQNIGFINPDIMGWEFSGEGLLMVIIGGSKYFFGPVVGAGMFVLIKEQLSAVTDDYIFFFGLFFILVVALFRDGITGFVVTKIGLLRGGK